MKRLKRIFGSIVFLAIGLVLTILTSYVMRSTNDDTFFFRNRFTGFYAEEDDTLDVIGLGGSGLYRYFNSPLLYESTGITSYPLCTAQQSIFVTERMIDEVLKSQSPQLLVLEARRFLFTNKRKVKKSMFRLLTDNMNYSANRFSMINEQIDWSERLSYYFDLMLYHENWENLSLDSFKYLFNNRPHPLKGWKDSVRVTPVNKPDVSEVTDETPLPEVSEETLLRVIEKCREKNLDVLFVLTPFEIDEETQKMSNYMRRIVEENGFQFLDCNLCIDEMGLDFTADFHDNRHTNSVGADKFTRYLGQYILENYDIDTSHSPEVIADWDRAAKENRENYKEVSETIYQKAQDIAKSKSEQQ